MARFVKFTYARDKREFFMVAEHVRGVERSPTNALLTLIVTNLMTASGPLAHEVMESPEEAVRQVEAALAGPPSIALS